MALLDWISSDQGLLLEGQGVVLRPPRMSDFPAWADLRARSAEFLRPWEPEWPEDDLTRSAFRRRLSVYARDLELGQGFPFLVFREDDNALVGGLTLSNIRRGIAQTATLGYWIGHPFARRGYTLSAVRLATRFCFGRLGLHRVEAACLPSNEPSRNLLLKAGFSLEGKARAYLKINGAWRDHLLFGLLEDGARWEDEYSSGG